MNKTTVALTKDQYINIINLIKEGFTNNNKRTFGNPRVATALVLQANLGLRIGDILSLRLEDIIKDGDRYRLDIIEDKTNKKRTFTVPTEIYEYIKKYTIENGIKPSAIILNISERAVQKQLKLIVDFLGYENVSTHSFRKYYATSIYINNNYNIELVRQLLQHSSVTTTQKYVGIERKELESAIQKHICLM